MKLRIKATSSRNTAALIIQAHLEAREIEVVRGPTAEGCDATLCWGRSSADIPSLNGQANRFNKMEALTRFHLGNIPAPTYTIPRYFVPTGELWLGRRLRHTQGKDIVPVLTCEAATCDFLVKYIPTQAEYRVWAFRGVCLAVYEKVYKGEGEYAGIQRNQAFGFRFDMRKPGEYPAELDQLGPKAVAAIDLDWGAVDIIQGKDGKLYVLEVNSAPDIEGPKRVSGIRLAKAVSKWCKAGFPAREENA